MSIAIEDIKQAIHVLNEGGIIAYPTESVFGLGCNPFNASAVEKILLIKRRLFLKGFILITSSWEQVEALTQPLRPEQRACVQASWPGPVTWVFPADSKLPAWLTGDRPTIAIRQTNHPVAKALCDAYGGPIVSTSANRAGEIPTTDYHATMLMFGEEVDFIMPGRVGELVRPTPIIDARTGEQIRQ
ncbi:MAG: threonylcarbamoyl-AMP synthase [Coxiella sp. RIFCSPHIGHO2_12_FULL_44_14]|nr:MAG: threonylcarbamoyl-AMP synthase [Coxiella sp. RIFCSPHIGHO2_12_FULL_44_14]